MKRIEEWRKPFSDVIDSMNRVPFSWGDNDCAVGLVGNVLEAMTGKNPAAEYKGRYSTAEEGLKIVKEAGFENLADFVASYLPEIHISEASMGDIVAVPSDDSLGYVLGIANGDRALIMTPRGVGSVDLLKAERAFKV